MQLSYASSATQPTLTVVPLSTAVDGREYASSLIFTPKSTNVETMFVYGGLSGSDGYGIPAINFYAIALQGTVGTVTALAQTGSNVPSTAAATAVTSNPTMFVSPSTFDHIYFYGGLDASGDVFADPSKLFIYQFSTNQWLSPTSPAHSSHSAVSFNPYIVCSATIITADYSQVMLLGGDYGLGNSADNEVNGTHSNVFHLDLTPLAANPTGQPYLAQLKYSLPYRVESPVSALISNTTVVSWSGSQYSQLTPPAPPLVCIELNPGPGGPEKYKNIFNRFINQTTGDGMVTLATVMTVGSAKCKGELTQYLQVDHPIPKAFDAHMSLPHPTTYGALSTASPGQGAMVDGVLPVARPHRLNGLGSHNGYCTTWRCSPPHRAYSTPTQLFDQLTALTTSGLTGRTAWWRVFVLSTSKLSDVATDRTRRSARL